MEEPSSGLAPGNKTGNSTKRGSGYGVAGCNAVDHQCFAEHTYACKRVRSYFGKVDASPLIKSEEFAIGVSRTL